MRDIPQCGVIGSAIHQPSDPDNCSLEESIYRITQLALADAALTINEIEGIVVAGNDQLDGRAISIMAASGSVGGVGRDILCTPSAAEHAFVLGTLRVASGQYRTQLVVAWSPLEVNSISEVQRLCADPYYHRSLPLDELSANALQAVALEAVHPQLRQAAIAVQRKNRAHGEVAYSCHSHKRSRSSPMLRWPLAGNMTAPYNFGLVAMVLADEDWIAERACKRPAWIGGIGWAVETAFLGDRKLSELPSLSVAAKRAYAAAGINDPAATFDLAEVADSSPYQELLAYEGLQLCTLEEAPGRLESRFFSAEGALPVNLSGGALTVNPAFCSGLVRIAEAANQVRGCAGQHQKPEVRYALAHAASGPAMQCNTVAVFTEAKKECE